MKMLFLGTAAAEGVPSLFCQCEHCRYAWEHGGKEIRGRSGALIDGTLRIDFGPDAFKQMLDYRIDLKPMKSVLITHSHADHLAAAELSYRRNGFARLDEGDPVLTVYGNAAVGEKIKAFLNPFMQFNEIKPFEPVDVEGYRVTGLEAVHFIDAISTHFVVETRKGRLGRKEEAMFYLIEKDGKSILYAHDTDEFTPRDMEYLAGKHIDLITLDCTNAAIEADYVGHMGAQGNLRMRDKLMANGAADEHTVFVANHFSHNGLAPYETMQQILPGFLVSYDGMTVEV